MHKTLNLNIAKQHNISCCNSKGHTLMSILLIIDEDAELNRTANSHLAVIKTKYLQRGLKIYKDRKAFDIIFSKQSNTPEGTVL